jgi:acetyl esterase/lipase
MNTRTPSGFIRPFLALAGVSALVFFASAIDSPVVSAKAKFKIDPVTGTKYKADSDMQEILTAFAALGGKPIETPTPAQARAQPTLMDAVVVVMKQRAIDTDPTKLAPDVTTVNLDIPGQTPDRPLASTVYTPVGPGPFPAVLYFHDGGWVIGSKKSYDASARALAQGAGAVVFSVDYHLAPENRFPAAWEDALTAYKWLAANAGTWRGDPRRLALAGEGAGGTLALATAIGTADAGLTRPKAVIAIYPYTQAGSETESYVDSANAKVLDKTMIAWFRSNTLASGADKADPRLDLIHGKLSLLPPVTIINAQIDPLRSDGAILEEALKQAGIPVSRKEYEGVTHDFFGAAPVLPAAKKAQSFAADQLKDAFKE